MDTANFVNVEVRVCYSFSKHNIFNAKAKESFVIVWITEEIVQKFACMEVVKFTDRDQTFWDVSPTAPRGRFQTLRPANG